ncbi:MAG: flavin reductase family protein [Prevotella sp.]
MKEITAAEWKVNPFTAIGKDWMLIAATKDGKTNMMTASWGGMGVLWGADVVFVFIRQSRFTKEFIEGSDKFSLTFFAPEYRKTMAYIGSHSGRDEDKIAKTGLHVVTDEETPYFEEAHTAVLCTKWSKHPIRMEDMPEDVRQRWYADGDYHDMYIGRIEKILVKQ